MTTTMFVRKVALFLSWVTACGITGNMLAYMIRIVSHVIANYMLLSMALAFIAALATVSLVSRGMDRLNMSDM